MRWWHIEDLMPIEADIFGDEQWTQAMFWSELANSHHYIVDIDDRGAVAGYAGLAIIPPDEAWIQNIAVRRDRQRLGRGRAMLSALLDEASKRGASSILLEVAVDNDAAQKLYGSYGFEGIGIRKGYYQPSNTDALVMRRDD